MSESDDEKRSVFAILSDLLTAAFLLALAGTLFYLGIHALVTAPASEPLYLWQAILVVGLFGGAGSFLAMLGLMALRQPGKRAGTR